MLRSPRTAPLRWPLQAALVGLCWLGALVAPADTWIDTHDEPDATWQVDKSLGAEVLARERVRTEGPRQGEEVGAERIAYAAAPGVPTWAWRPAPAAAVIDELQVEVDVRTTLPGVLLAVDVVLPETPDPEGGLQTLRLRGEPIRAAVGGVTTLTLRDLPLRLQREARVWRVTNQGKTLDTRGAYVKRLVLGLPGSGRPAQVWVHEARIDALVTPLHRADDGGLQAKAPDDPEATPDPTPNPAPVGGTVRPTQVTLRSDGFRLDGELFFPRVWRWHGEPFEQLAARGINTVWIDQTPTPQQLAEAAHHRLRIFCPPPASASEAANVASWDRVLAWVLRGEVDARGLDAGLVVAEDARALGADIQRPILAHTSDDAAAWARVADGLLIDAVGSRSPGGPERFARQASGAPAGTPMLAVVPLDVGTQLAAQLDALLGDGVAMAWLPPADVSSAVDRALRQGVSGLVYTAQERLDEPDDASQAAAGWLEAINRRLRLIEPWLTGPHSASPITASETAVLLNRGGVRLAAAPSLGAPAPVAPAPAPKPHTGLPSDPNAMLLLPGVDETAHVYRLSPAGLTPWSTSRVTGGVGAPRTGGDSPGDLLVCNDPRVFKSLRDYTQQTAAKAAANLAAVAGVRLRLSEALSPADRQSALRRLGEARLAMSRRDYGAAYDASHAALALVSDAEVGRRAIARQGAWASSSPLDVLPSTLTDHFRMSQLLAASQRGPNLLYGGSFEDIDELRRFGWRHPEVAGAEAVGVDLVTAEAVHGKRVLRLEGNSPQSASRILSPPIDLTPGDTVEITGWARVEASSKGGGVLVVSDSLGGDELALAVGPTGGQWRPFQLLRATSADTELRFTLAIEGAVAADVDGVMVRTVEPLGFARRPTRTAAAPAADRPQPK